MTFDTIPNIATQISKELSVKLGQVTAAVALLDEGSTVPFISRYRKEATGGLTDTQLRNLEERLRYLRELNDRKQVIYKSIEEQGKLTDLLKSKILDAESKTVLEDLYLPFKPKRRTKGSIAIEAGLEPLAEALFTDPTLNPEAEAEQYINGDKGIEDIKSALDGAKYILMERFSENAELIQGLRNFLWDNSVVYSTVIEDQKSKGEKFKDYFDYNEALCKIPSHRALALFRGRTENILQISIDVEHSTSEGHPCIDKVARQFNIVNSHRSADAWLQDVVRWTWKVKLSPHLESELLTKLRLQSEEEAINVFATNLKSLLFSAPAGSRVTLGLDPGLRTGVKAVVVDQTGKLLTYETIFPHVPKKQWDQSLNTLKKMCSEHSVDLVSIGNGTASRETDALVSDLIKLNPELNITSVITSEAGASIYSASEFAAREFPDLDVSFRGAVSIARRLQDPLAELVKIEPKAIGVGQYQHDVSQVKLARSLNAVVEDCVNSVGVDLNLASVPLLAQVAGLNNTIAQNIVSFRDANGSFKNRKSLKEVPRLGEKAFQQAAGFLKLTNGDNLLDSSSVHPETYTVVEAIASANNRSIESIIGDVAFLKNLNPNDFINDDFGLITIKDIILELQKPGRDPRPEFKTAKFEECVQKISDLEPDMILEGVVTNVTNFGAFVDIGVHQDGLVHISVMSNSYVKNPNDVLKTGDIVKVKVLEIDIARKRISLSMRLQGDSQSKGKGQDNSSTKEQGKSNRPSTQRPRKESTKKETSGNMAQALLSAGIKKSN